MSSKHPPLLVLRILNKGYPPHHFQLPINRRRLRKTRLRHPPLDFLISGKHPLFLPCSAASDVDSIPGPARIPPSSTLPFSPIRSPPLLINEHQPSPVRFLLLTSAFKRHSKSPFTCSLAVWIIVLPPATWASKKRISCLHVWTETWQLTSMMSRSAAAKLNVAGVVTIASTQVPIVTGGPQVTNVTCMFLPTYVRNDLLVQALSAYGKVLEITHATDHRATFDYSGIKRVCRQCRLEGHIRVNCTTEHCDRCAVFKHAREGCTSDCRWCGGSHATVDCVARQSYSSMVAGTASSDFPALSPAHEVTPHHPAAQTGAPTAQPQAYVDPEKSQPALSWGRPLRTTAPGGSAAGRGGCNGPRDATRRTGTRSLSAVDTSTPWSEVTEDPEASRDSERLVIMEEESWRRTPPFLLWEPQVPRWRQ
ncbi:hypothetical protein HPB47_018017 [Ixodes persulcatus]|uniref:Uncharacterized protein n=1 Tax=Ixodes persulcatus TaxID=34615 RepID=A0AC60QZW6_IXOPE|nr:hypothetical protein HPB47_018017 [Ixodes persulcatus]